MTTKVSRVETKIPKMRDTAKPLKMGSSKIKNAPIMAAKKDLWATQAIAHGPESQ
jgi:hypothetical protein